ncbi:5-oxoprolinase subunit PxpA [Nocardioides xinjiangensis]|uniref:5-oxoprolinase subunit PxpA n=1 Tax=Nocardioides xinjiangensis TaxID=2817376 RepID=UPI001B30C516|nr:5-oxoprolinase subunit PxpA [Nocardioides sp. SYSU D00514]
MRSGRDRSVDLNADLGEEVTDDAGLLAVVTSANVACGFHAGTPETMRTVCAGAVASGVTVGAQVSYDDRENFGRVARDVPPAVLREQVAEQVGVLSAVAASEGGGVAYLKPHGALYHRVAVDGLQASAVLDGSGDLPVLGMPGSLLLSLAGERGRGVRLEGFPDRGYTPGGGLLPRDRPGALVTDPDEVARRAVRLAAQVHSVCVHGDSPGAVTTAGAVRRALEAAGLLVRSCWSAPAPDARAEGRWVP